MVNSGLWEGGLCAVGCGRPCVVPGGVDARGPGGHDGVRVDGRAEDGAVGGWH